MPEKSGSGKEWGRAILVAIPAAFMVDPIKNLITSWLEHHPFAVPSMTSIGDELTHPTFWPELLAYTALTLLGEISLIAQVYLLRTAPPEKLPRGIWVYMIVRLVILVLLIAGVRPVLTGVFGWFGILGALYGVVFALSSLIAFGLGCLVRLTGGKGVW